MTHTLLLSITHTLLLLLLVLLSFSATAAVAQSTLPPDAVSLLAFKSHADLDHRLFYLLTEPFDYCQWQGVKCAQGRVVRLALPGLGLRGSLVPDSLSRLDQLRVLTLCNNSLSGPIPDLSQLQQLKSLFLSHNHFAGSFPLSLISLHRLVILDLARNALSGPLPDGLNALDRLTSLRLEFNRFNGSLPSLNHSLLSAFNVSGNNLSGPIPITPTLTRFGPTSFSLNSALCGEVLNRPCDSPASPFFGSSADGPGSPQQRSSPQVQTSESSESVVLSPNSPAKNHNKTGLIVGFVIAVALLVAIVLSASVAIRRRRGTGPKQAMVVHTPAAETELGRVTEGAVQTKAKVVTEVRTVPKNGNLVFAEGEAPLYGLEQLMRASAELLGRGTVGTTYKAVLDNQLVLTVKRLDAGKTAVTGSEAFGRQMDAIGGLRHPNLVPVRAYFQAKGERLVLFDYQPNGSLFNLIHGSRSTRAKPLHWTSCLKIAEDVAQGLAYIHNASKLTHGNLKSTNVLLGPDFEACLTDYGLAALAEPPAGDDGGDPDSSGYRAPETRKWGRWGTAESDVYSFGVLLLELLTGKNPSQHPFVEVPEWVRAAREEEDAADDGGQLGMLADVACICRSPSPEQRPAMWQVLKMIQEIKDSVGAH